jgi:hydrophobe/amphiphile efflux-1 (HAE1) family protein
MSFNISAWSIRKPIATLVLFLVLMLAGIVSYPSLGIDENPNIEVPTVIVTVTQPGADPTELETQITKKVEDSIAGLGNIDQIISTVNDGVSSTVVNFVLGTNDDRATNDVRNAIAQIRQDLPQDANDPIVERIDFSGGPIVTYSVTSPQRSVTELSNLVDQTISRALLAVPGVSEVKRSGGVNREIRINLNPDRLQAVGITATQVNDQIRGLNINLPGGRGEVGGTEQTIRTLGSATSVEALQNYQITLPKGSFVPLSSLGQVTDGTGDIRQMARINQKPAVVFSVIRSTGTVLVGVEEGVQKAVAGLRKTLPQDIKIELINNARAEYIRESYAASIEAILLGAALAIVTIWLFLRDWRATLITAIAMPLSLIPAFSVLKLLGYTLNFMTLLSLALVVGILVDDAIVEIENIERHQAMGKSPFRAALDASDEIGLAVVATTMSIVAVFGPVSLMTGISGQFFRPFAVTVSVTVLFSLLVARTVTPLMGAYLLKDKPQAEHHLIGQDWLSRWYRQMLKWALKHRLLTLAIALIFLVGSFMLVPYIPVGLFNNGDLSLSIINMELPPGASIATTDRASQQLTALLLKNPNVETVQTNEEIKKATLFVKLKPVHQRKQSQQDFEKEFRTQFKDIPGVRLSFDSGGVNGGKELSIVLKSEDGSALTQSAQTLEKQMSQIPGLVEVSSSASLLKPEILIKPDLPRAADQGVDVATIARTAILATLGDNDSSLAKFNLSDRQIPIRVQLAPSYRNDIETIRNLQIQTKGGELIPLQSVADISFGSGPSQIDRLNRARQVSIEANLQGIALGNAIQAVHALPAYKNLPPTVKEEQFGNAKIQAELFGNIGFALGAAILFIYTVLVLLFADFLHPITIMVALPFSLGGAFLGLLITHKDLGLFALIGIILLIGLVTKNSILLVDFTLLNLREGKPLFAAVIESGVARLRPILMTTIAMITGMLPIALGIGAGSQVRSPMAITIIGGLISSTLLTLIVVPVIFTYIDTLQHFVFNRLLKGVSQRRSKEEAMEDMVQ